MKIVHRNNINNGWCVNNMNHGHITNNIASRIDQNNINNSNNNNNINQHYHHTISDININNSNNHNNNNNTIDKKIKHEDDLNEKLSSVQSMSPLPQPSQSSQNLPPSLLSLVNEYTSHDVNEQSSFPHKKMSVENINSQLKSKPNENPTTTTTTTRTQAVFVNKLYKMLEDVSIHSLIHWSENGDLFCVSNPTTFSELVLPQYFKHNNWQSFVRQLNMYGFHKVNDMIHSNLTTESQKWEFKHQHFRRGAVDELQNIKRKSAKSHHQSMSSPASIIPISSKVSPSSSVGAMNSNSNTNININNNSIATSSRSTLSPLSTTLAGKNQFTNVNGNTEKRSVINNNNNLNHYKPAGDDKSNHLVRYIISLEEKVDNLSHTYDNLGRETVYLQSIVFQQQSALQNILEMVETTSKPEYDSQNYIGSFENIKSQIEEIKKSILSKRQQNMIQPEIQLPTSSPSLQNNILNDVASSSTTTLENPSKNKSLSAFIFDSHSSTSPPPLSSTNYERKKSIELHHHHHQSIIDKPSLSSSSRMSISCINSIDTLNHQDQDQDQHQRQQLPSPPPPPSSSTTPMIINRSLPSINLVHENTAPKTLSPPPSSITYRHPSLSSIEHDTVMKPLTPIRNLLEEDLRPRPINKNIINNDTISRTTTPMDLSGTNSTSSLSGTSFDSRPISPFMGLGRESPLLNPDNSHLKQPLPENSFDNHHTTNEPKRRKTDA